MGGCPKVITTDEEVAIFAAWAELKHSESSLESIYSIHFTF